jgi:hypothetical protein
MQSRIVFKRLGGRFFFAIKQYVTLVSLQVNAPTSKALFSRQTTLNLLEFKVITSTKSLIDSVPCRTGGDGYDYSSGRREGVSSVSVCILANEVAGAGWTAPAYALSV